MCVCVCVCVCECVCVYRAASRATVQCKHGKHAGHLQKRLLCSLASKSRQYSQLHSLKACLYVNRHAYLVGLRGFIRSYTPFTHLNRHASYTPLTHLNRHAYLVGLRGFIRSYTPLTRLNRHSYLVGLRGFIRKDPRLGSLGMSSKTPEEEAAAAVRAALSSCLVSCSSSTPSLLEGSDIQLNP